MAWQSDTSSQDVISGLGAANVNQSINQSINQSMHIYVPVSCCQQEEWQLHETVLFNTLFTYLLTYLLTYIFFIYWWPGKAKCDRSPWGQSVQSMMTDFQSQAAVTGPRNQNAPCVYLIQAESEITAAELYNNDKFWRCKTKQNTAKISAAILC